MEILFKKGWEKEAGEILELKKEIKDVEDKLSKKRDEFINQTGAMDSLYKKELDASGRLFIDQLTNERVKAVLKRFPNGNKVELLPKYRIVNGEQLDAKFPVQVLGYDYATGYLRYIKERGNTDHFYNDLGDYLPRFTYKDCESVMYRRLLQYFEKEVLMDNDFYYKLQSQRKKFQDFLGESIVGSHIVLRDKLILFRKAY